MRQSARVVLHEVRQVCRSAPDAISLQRAAVGLLADAVPFDRWCGLVLDPATLLVTSGYHDEGLPVQVMPRLLEIEAADTDVNGMVALARSASGVSTVDRATGGNPQTSERYRDVLAPSGLGRELRAVLRERSSGWGGLVLLRETTATDFTDDEMELVARLTADLARGIRRCLLRSELEHRDDAGVPGMVVVAAGGMAVETSTTAGRRWLEALDGGTVGDGLPMAVAGLVARARTAAEGLARTRVRARDGQWLSLYAEALSAAVDAPVAVVVEPTRPLEMAAVMADAYELTPRERDVAAQVLIGRSTQEIAAALFLSAWTVQDHLKKVFDKVGVRSRSELTARFFFGHYEPRVRTGVPLGADGWFVA